MKSASPSTPRAPSLLAFGEAPVLFAAVAILMLLSGIGFFFGYFYVDPPRYAPGLMLGGQAILISVVACAGQAGLGDFVGVLQARAAPLGAMRTAMRALRRRALQFWLLCAAPLVLIAIGELMVRPAGDWSEAASRLGAGPALLALLLLGCAACTAAWQGRISTWIGLFALALVGACLSACWGERGPAWVAAGWPAHLAAMLLLWPALSRLFSVPPRPRARLPFPRRLLRRVISTWQQHVHFIDRRAKLGAFGFFWLLPQQLPVWGDRLNGHDVLRLGLLTLLACTLLQSRDLHWRRMLAPGGMRRATLGLRIVADSLRASMLLLTIGGVVGVAISAVLGWVLERPLETFLLTPLPTVALTLLVELPLCTALAACLRGLTGSSGLTNLCAWVLMMLGLCLLFSATPVSQLLHWHVGPTYLATVVALSLFLLSVVGRCWRTTNLVELMRGTQPDKE